MICNSCNSPIKKNVGVCDNKNCANNPIHEAAFCQNAQCNSKNIDPVSMGARKYQYICKTCGFVSYAHFTTNGIVYKKIK